MTSRIRLVQGDNLPTIRMTLRHGDGTPINLQDATVVVYFRAAGTDTVLSTLSCAKLNNGVSGEVSFNFPGSTLDVEPGPYEGEIEIDFGGERQTVYDTLKFTVRAQFQ
jgi:hypothetical protein